MTVQRLTRGAPRRVIIALEVAGVIAFVELSLVGASRAGAPVESPQAPTTSPSDADRRRAEELHERAVAAFDRGSRAEAIEFGRQANVLHPFWKYAYNLSNTLTIEGRFEEAWPIAEQARVATPEPYQKTLDQRRAKLGAELAKTHAWIAVSVVPAEAKVLRNKLPLPPPRAIWTRDAAGELEIEAAGHQPQRIALSHRAGDRVEPPPIVLVPDARGELVVTGGQRARSSRSTTTPSACCRASRCRSRRGSIASSSSPVARDDALDHEHDLATAGAWVKAGVHTSAIATGVALYLTGDAGEPKTDGRVQVGVGLAPGGAALDARVSF